MLTRGAVLLADVFYRQRGAVRIKPSVFKAEGWGWLVALWSTPSGRRFGYVFPDHGSAMRFFSELSA